MEQWVSADGFLPADVIRWTEGIYDRRGRGKKARRVGERLITAEVLACTDDGWVRLLVRASEITADEFAGTRIPAVKSESAIKRATKTIHRGKVQRLLWSDESARDAVARTAATAKSRFAPS